MGFFFILYVYCFKIINKKQKEDILDMRRKMTVTYFLFNFSEAKLQSTGFIKTEPNRKVTPPFEHEFKRQKSQIHSAHK